MFVMGSAPYRIAEQRGASATNNHFQWKRRELYTLKCRDLKPPSISGQVAFINRLSLNHE
jgi:hypothetical protein